MGALAGIVRRRYGTEVGEAKKFGWVCVSAHVARVGGGWGAPGHGAMPIRGGGSAIRGDGTSGVLLARGTRQRTEPEHQPRVEARPRGPPGAVASRTGAGVVISTVRPGPRAARARATRLLPLILPRHAQWGPMA